MIDLLLLLMLLLFMQLLLLLRETSMISNVCGFQLFLRKPLLQFSQTQRAIQAFCRPASADSVQASVKGPQGGWGGGGRGL